MAMLFVVTGTMSAATYYVATNGSDSNAGSIDRPWFSVKYALTKLTNTDTLYLREGTYYETGLSISNRSRILFSAYAQEKVEITGGIPDFTVAPNVKWELYDAATNLYRTKDIYPGSGYANVWLLDDRIQLVQYANMLNLQSTNYGPVHGFTPMYQGRGFLFHPDGHLYLRLQNNPNDLIDPLGKPINPIPADIDPNRHRMSISFTVSNSSSVKVKNLTISHAKYLFDITSSSPGFEFDGCSFNYGIYAFVLRGSSTSPNARDYEIHDCDFNNGLPDYVYWCDVKNKDQEVGEAYPEFQSEAIAGPAPGFYIHNNRFHDSFDAMDLDGGTENTRILYNEFLRLRDDAITFGAELPAKVSSGPDLYVYNNVFLILDDRICFRGRLASSGAHYDGNVMYRLLDTTYHQPQPSSFPLFSQFGNGSSFSTLADFRSRSGTDWESKGLEVDPQMDVNRIVRGSYDGGEATWKRYFPRNNSVSTQGVSYEGLNWPGTEGVRYRGAMVDSLATGIGEHLRRRGDAPDGFELGQNYPNPFNPRTAISYQLSAVSFVNLRVYNMLGRVIATLANVEQPPGRYQVTFDAGNLSSGVFFYRLQAGNFVDTKKLVLLK